MSEYKKLALELAMADSEHKVEKLIKNNKLLSDPNNWAPYNNEEKNWDRIGNQTANPAAALTEKIVNSIDAVLIKECLKRGIDPEGPNAPQNMRDAVETFFNVPKGMLGNSARDQRKKLADNIQIIVSGDSTTPCYTIIDKGEGQLPEKFAKTYVSLSQKNKEGISFVQGKYNMGGSAALPYCGTNFFQLIIAKRHNDLVEDKENNLWGFTLLRRRLPKAGEKCPVVEYFILNGKNGSIATFSAKSLPLIPENSKNLYKNGFECGTFIKLYSYKMGADRSVDFGLNNALCRTMYMTCLPMWLKDARVKRGHTWERVFAGADVRLENEDQDYIMKDDIVSLELGFFDIGTVKCAALPLTKQLSWLRKYSALYIMNGQTHAYETQDFLDRAKLAWLKRRLLVVVDCTEIKQEKQWLIFKPDRERMWEQPEANRLRKELQTEISKNKGLRELNRRIHEEAIMSRVDDETDTNELFSQLAQSDPNMAALFDLGGKLTTFVRDKKGTVDPEKFQGRKYPTMLEPLKDIGKNGPIEIPAGSFRYIQAKTDAVNDYLLRARERGQFIYTPKEWSAISNLNNGLAIFKLTIPEDATVGEIHTVNFSFNDVEKIQPLGFEFRVKVTAKQQDKKDDDDDQPDEDKKKDEEKKKRKKKILKLKENPNRNMPDIIEVNKGDDNWDNFEMDEKSGFVIMQKPDSTAIEIYLNMSNIYFSQFLFKYKRESDREVLKKQYKVSMGLAGCSIWKLIKNKEGKEDIIKIYSSALSQIILSAIRKLGMLTISDTHENETQELVEQTT